MKLLVILVIVGVLGGGYWYASQRGWLPSAVPKLSLQGNPQDQLGILSSRAQELGGYAQGFINSSVQVDNQSAQSLSQKAMDYGQYLYCKQVVTTYEAQQAASTQE